MARPTKRTPERASVITEALTKGYTRAAAAAVAGIVYDTLREWEKDDPEFSEALEKAEGTAQVRLIDKIAADKSWQSAAWMLERRWPAEYARREKVEMTGKDGGPIDHRSVSTLTDHERSALADAIRAHLRGETAPALDPAGDRQE